MRLHQRGKLGAAELVGVACGFGNGHDAVGAQQAAELLQIAGLVGNFAEHGNQHDAVKAAVGEIKRRALAKIIARIADSAFCQPFLRVGKHFGLDVRQHQFALRHGLRQRGAEIACAAAHFQHAMLRRQMQPRDHLARR